MSLLDDLIDARLRSGRPAEIIAEATRAAAAQPWRESTHVLLMQALALDGRAAEALDVARVFRRLLDDEVGLEPTAALGDLEQQIAGGERQRQAQEVALVEVAPVAGSGAVPFVLAQVLGVRGGSDITAAVLDHLSSRQVLLVIDNCEHLLDVVRELCATLLRSPR